MNDEYNLGWGDLEKDCEYKTNYIDGVFFLMELMLSFQKQGKALSTIEMLNLEK